MSDYLVSMLKYVFLMAYISPYSLLFHTVTVYSDAKLLTILKYQIGSIDCSELVGGVATTLIPC